ncbi:MAG: hypothetical protein DRH33_03605 [Candidatus Nealsonbacteria bacterium]|nr:MAG: hypothetical protein DRH33_03605 [Candidatus Nealsonbacteria bacterium]
MRKKKMSIGVVMLLICLFIFSGTLFAEVNYPNKAITVVVPYGAGGGVDTLARIYAGVAKDYFGQPWVVENRPGAGAALGINHVLKSDPDGYTAVMFGSSPLIGAYIEKNLPYTPEDLKNLSIVTIHKMDDLIIVTHPDKPWSTWEGLVKYAKEHPGELDIGCGLLFHLLTENIFRQAGIDINWVPYDSSSTALSDFLGGHVDLNAHVLTTVNELIKGGKATGLLFDGPLDPKEFPTLQGIPTASELGYEGMLLGQPMAFPPETPDEIVEFASKAMGKLLKDPRVIELIKKRGGKPYYLPSEEAQKKHEETMDFIEKKLKEMDFID